MGAALLVYLIKRNFELKSHIRKAEFIQYVDTSGIEKNPPRYTELMKGTTINFMIGKYAVKIPQVGITKGLDTIRLISGYYNTLCREIDNNPETKADKLKRDVTLYQIQLQIITLIYDLSYKFVKKRRQYRKVLIKELLQDVSLLISICEEIIDYWSCVGKSLSRLATGGTKRQTYGGNVSANLPSTGSDGKIEIKPRFALHTKSSNSKTKTQDETPK